MESIFLHIYVHLIPGMVVVWSCLIYLELFQELDSSWGSKFRPTPRFCVVKSCANGNFWFRAPQSPQWIGFKRSWSNFGHPTTAIAATSKSCNVLRSKALKIFRWLLTQLHSCFMLFHKCFVSIPTWECPNDRIFLGWFNPPTRQGPWGICPPGIEQHRLQRCCAEHLVLSATCRFSPRCLMMLGIISDVFD